ncbi:hypothetical protein CpB0625 [Chlamydia pneumoniae TW-183]|uniref:Uncharacterized protein n=1 Tax=Chlamydia pneumoniae TaxID=83558 RepID=A0ABM5LCW4_CHLPN|nr:hypothetical protein CpB0625 [Chlamydia pneumoniae TW-183]
MCFCCGKYYIYCEPSCSGIYRWLFGFRAFTYPIGYRSTNHRNYSFTLWYLLVSSTTRVITLSICFYTFYLQIIFLFLYSAWKPLRQPLFCHRLLIIWPISGLSCRILNKENKNEKINVSPSFSSCASCCRFCFWIRILFSTTRRSSRF